MREENKGTDWQKKDGKERRMRGIGKDRIGCLEQIVI